MKKKTRLKAVNLMFFLKAKEKKTQIHTHKCNVSYFASDQIALVFFVEKMLLHWKWLKQAENQPQQQKNKWITHLQKSN